MRPPLFGFLDRRDERLARSLRDALGRRGRLVSWHRAQPPSGPKRWIARVSCREIPETIEGDGASRCRAIRAAAASLDHQVAFRRG